MPKSRKRKKKMNPEKLALIKELAEKKVGSYSMAGKAGKKGQDGGSKVGASGTKAKLAKTSKGDR